jgi:exodeoxyribonuclease VII large subunit
MDLMKNREPQQLPCSVISVSALNRLARDVLERALPLMWVRGEISNFISAASGHWYFTLKDAGAQVRCAMFRNKARFLDWRPENGVQVEVRALPTVYEPRGEFQLNVDSMRRAGMGALYEAFERLKARLDAEGLFDPMRKRALPPIPRAIGIVTSAQAAALRDVLSILAQRMPAIPVIVYPTPVQGDGAAQRIANMIHTASARAECDVLIVCRGGGSIEDLWAFNEEVVARAIYACAVPVVSGVGHETDFTIADFVADMRAPTPSAAAQAVCPDRRELMRSNADRARLLGRALQRYLERHMQAVDYLSHRLVDPRERLQAERERLRHLTSRLAAAGTASVSHIRWVLLDCARRLLHARFDPGAYLARVQQASLRLDGAAGKNLSASSAVLEGLRARLETLNPHAVLERGYAIASDPAGRILRDSSLLSPGDRLRVQFARGAVDTEVKNIDLANDQMRERK